MNLMDRFDEKLNRMSQLELLKSGAAYVFPGAKISEIYDRDTLPAQLESFFIKRDKSTEANEAISWWRALPPDKKAEFDR
ncbi:hypothetical protein ACX3SV_03940 [Hafnia paralvei]